MRYIVTSLSEIFEAYEYVLMLDYPFQLSSVLYSVIHTGAMGDQTLFALNHSPIRLSTLYGMPQARRYRT